MILTAGAPRHLQRRGVALPGGARRARTRPGAALQARPERLAAGVPFSEFTVPIDHASLAGHVASTGEPLVIDDVYLLPPGASYKQNRSFDERVRLPHQVDARLPMLTHAARRRSSACCSSSTASAIRAVLDVRRGRRARGDPVRRARRGARGRARVAGRRRAREQPALRGHREAVRGLRDRGRSPRSSRAIRPPRATPAASPTLTVGLAAAVDRGGAGPYAAFRFTREQMRRSATPAAARLRQGRRARAGAGEGRRSSTVRRPRADPPPRRAPAAARRAAVRARARGLPARARPARLRGRRCASCDAQCAARDAPSSQRFLDVGASGQRADDPPRGRRSRSCARSASRDLHRLRRRRSSRCSTTTSCAS